MGSWNPEFHLQSELTKNKPSPISVEAVEMHVVESSETEVSPQDILS